MFKTILKILGGVLLLLVVLVAAMVMSMRAKNSDNRFALQPSVVSGAVGSYLLFGATRNTGLEVAKILTARGDKVTAFVRPGSDRTKLEKLGVDFRVGDATDLDTVRAAFDGAKYRAVVTTMGCFRCEPPPDFVGNRNVIDAAQAAGASRFLLISSVGAGDSADATPFLSSIVLRGVLPLKTQAEQHLQASDLDYTILRPGGLRSDTPTGNGYLTEDRDAFGFIHRADLAQLMVGVLDDDRTIGKIFMAADSSRSSLFD